MQEFKNEPKKHRRIITPIIFGNFKTALINFTCLMSPQNRNNISSMNYYIRQL